VDRFAKQLPTQSLAIVVSGFAAASVPFSAPLPPSAPNCLLLVTPDVLQLALAGSTLTTTLPIPNVAALVGASLRQQVVLLEIASSAFVSTTATNTLVLTVGAF
jgi:hypothetical protein